MAEVNLDKKDKAILSVFSNNARLSYNQIAKLTRISKDSVRDRILRMQKRGIIHSYFTLIDYSKLGITLFNVYCKLKSTKDLPKQKLRPLLENNHITAVTWILGKFDLELQILVRDKNEIKSILSKCKFLNKIQELKIVCAGKSEIYSTAPGVTNTPQGREGKEIVLEKKDIELLILLGENSRKRIIDLAEELKLQEDEVRYKIKKLTNSGVIKGFYIRTAKSAMGTSRYLGLIRTKNKIHDNAIRAIKEMRNVFYLKKCKGQWDYILRFHTSSNKELVDTFYTLRDTFSKDLEDLNIHTILDIIKFNPSPKMLL